MRLKVRVGYYMKDGKKYTIEDAGSRIEAATASARTMKILFNFGCSYSIYCQWHWDYECALCDNQERTKEIGILKSSRYWAGDILMQFCWNLFQ